MNENIGNQHGWIYKVITWNQSIHFSNASIHNNFHLIKKTRKSIFAKCENTLNHKGNPKEKMELENTPADETQKCEE